MPLLQYGIFNHGRYNRGYKQQEGECEMKPWVREAVLWVGIAFMSSIINFLFLRWVASFPRFGALPFPDSCERINTFVTGMWVFVIVLAFGAVRVLLRELKRRVFVSTPSDCSRSKKEGLVVMENDKRQA